MNSAALKTEKRFLTISAVWNLLLGILGFTFALFSSSQAILLDGLFNLSYFATGLFTVKIASLVAGGDDERFPHGYAFFESLVNGMKGMLVLGVSVAAIIGAVQSLAGGGKPISAGTAIVYGISASLICWAMAYFSQRVVETTKSPLVRADMENWFVNAAISSCVLLAFAGIFLFEAVGLHAFVPYVDPVVVLAVVALSIGVPVRMAWNSLMQLLNRAPESKVIDEVVSIVDESLSGLPVKERFVRVVQPGRQRMVLVHVVLPAEHELDGLRDLDDIRARTQAALVEAHVATIVDMLFTADRQWGAPLSDGGAGSIVPSDPSECRELESIAKREVESNIEQDLSLPNSNVDNRIAKQEQSREETEKDKIESGDKHIPATGKKPNQREAK